MSGGARPRPRLPLRLALPIGLLILLALILTLSVGNAIWQRTHSMHQQARAEMLEEAAHLARMAERGLARAPDLVEADVTHLSTRPNLELAAVLDADGIILFSSRLAWKGRKAAEVIGDFDSDRFERATQTRLAELDPSPKSIRPNVLMPYQPASDGETLRPSRNAAIYLEYDLSRLDSEVTAMVLRGRLPDLLGAVLLTLLTGWLLHRHFARPLARLGEASRTVAAGDYRVRLDETGPAEIVDLARAFNRMGASLDKAVNDLRASQEQLAVTLHSIGDALIATDLAGQVVLMNPVAERLTGWPLAEARGKAVREVFRIENAKTGHAAEIPVERVLHEGLVVGLANHTVLFARDGGRVHIADSAAPIRDGQGNLIGVVMVFRDVSGEYRLREALRDSELHFRALANSGQALVWTSGTDMGCDYFNDIWLRFTGRSLERELGNGWTEGVHPDDLAACMETYVAAFDRREPFSMTYRLRRYDGAYRWIVDEGSPRHDGDGRFLGYVGHCLDITDRIEAEAEADRRRRELEAVFQALPDLFFRMTADGTILDFKAQRHADLYLTPEHFLGKRLRDVMPPEIAERFDQGVAEMRATGLPATYQYSLRMPDGERWFESRVNGLAGSDEIIALVREISDRKQAEREIHRLAYYDALTDLPNRRLFMDHLGLALAAARRSQQFGALLFVDLDQFKRVNDARGHGIGDAVLTQVGGRLHRFLRDDDTVARLGGDEFVVLLASLAGNVDTAARLAMAVAEKVRAVLATPFRVDDVDYHIGASIGITVFPKAGENAEDLLREADTAMYRAKEAGRNAIRYFEPAMQQAVQTRLALEQDLHDAIAGDELRLYLQPQLDRDGELVGAEALLRWQHPVRGLVAPTTFIPVAEESGMILALGDWVLREAARLSREFDDSGRPLRLAVNVSPRQFRQAGFVADVRETLRQAGADPTHLVLEVTESLVIEDIHDTIAKMEELSKLGIHFSIDDFGTGYSSLAYLKRLPLNELKIDRTFVQDAPTDPNDAALVETILSVASHLNLSVVAEGVETQAQLDFLKARGCRLFQGYLFDRPLPPERFRENWR